MTKSFYFGVILLLSFFCHDVKAQVERVNAIGIADTIHTRPIEVVADRVSGFTISRMNDIEAGVIYAGKKTEVVIMKELTANLSTNNSRQIFSGVAGLNIWESDAAGVQLGIGGRGLSPNRSSNFTLRQNGYDISADPLGYPESYYTPPAEALDRVEVVRGAGSLRYGTQFGGMVNFVFRDGGNGNPIEANASLTGGSFGFAAGFARVGGTTGGVTYTSFYQFKRSDGWRANSEFDMHTAYVSAKYPVTDAFTLKADYTFMTHKAHQPGGLSDAMFAANAQQSVRARNWFSVNWNLASITADYLVTDHTTIHTIIFGNASSRDAIGDLNRITMADLGGNRTLIAGTFQNIGLESSITSDFLLGDKVSTVVSGIRLFSGTTTQDQGSPTNQGSSYKFPNKNAAAFSEVLIKLTDDFSVTPGARLEYISTRANGWYTTQVTDFAGNVVADSTINENRTNNRVVGLFGVGLQYAVPNSVVFYANASQNYRSITFSDLRISNPNLKIDPSIHDERGYTIDVGVRGALTEIIQLNASAFYLRYNDKIGEVLRSDEAPLYLPYRFRTNISDAYTAGAEFVADVALRDAFALSAHNPDVHLLVNATVLDGRYINTENTSIKNKKVELVPNYIFRTTLRATYQGFAASIMWSAVGQQFTDATNATFSASAVNGIVPAYNVADLSLKYGRAWWSIDANINNIFDARYFTRRADSYPGPGIIPAEPLSMFLTFRASL
ncbi:MAG: TonB-dependent receptor [Ignavibacteria bacterium]|nr:TonB-dependent receptor [Ignavibacteria bacterium]